MTYDHWKTTDPRDREPEADPDDDEPEPVEEAFDRVFGGPPLWVNFATMETVMDEAYVVLCLIEQGSRVVWAGSFPFATYNAADQASAWFREHGCVTKLVVDLEPPDERTEEERHQDHIDQEEAKLAAMAATELPNPSGPERHNRVL